MQRKRRGIVSLRLLLLLFTGSLILLLLVVSLLAGMVGFRGYIVEQLAGHANDGAVAVGLSLSNAIDGRDPVASSSLIDATFDSGRYLSVRYNNVAQEFVIERQDEAQTYGVPSWFVDMMHLPLEEFRAQASVMRGWQFLGTVEVTSHPGAGYLDLWRMARRLALGTLVIGGGALLMLYLILRRTLRPLIGLERQAEAIRRRDFRFKAPDAGTRELARVTSAMNQMANDLGALFEGQAKLIAHLRQMNNEDRLTGVASRSAFDQRLRVAVETQESRRQGVLVMMQLAGFGEFNNLHGRSKADDILQTVAKRLKAFERMHPGSFTGRRAGAEFALFLPGAAIVDARFWMQSLVTELDGIYSDRAVGMDVAVHAGLAVATELSTVERLFEACDEALRQAQVSHESGCKVFDAAQSTQHGVELWRQHLQTALDNEAVKLLFQPLFRTSDHQVHYYQVLSRLDIDGEWVAAGVFVPMAERFQMMAQLDLLVVTRILAVLQQHPEAEFGITLGTSSLADETFRNRLNEILTGGMGLRKRLWICLEEDAVHHHRKEVGLCVRMLRRLGVRVLVDHFGVGGVPFSYLRNLPFQALRMDPSFIHNIDTHPDNRFYLESIVPIAHSRGVEVFVAGVETAAEWHVVAEAGVDGGTGYHLARPDENLP
ncbi:LapD/MoxY N-terminal periplasmic domain-containing protein [Marinobacter nanhaiticus D15-8W]|uniref:GGDEF domain-containing protein n=1 Tax=Marinobacter nanhaiticus D15-8W TaxID=626887 RepID=N6X421_9GAMM|nr:EAL domain-containing protein [Marinobacter nanhaiticus]ENO15828.1 GGDEF domain-containing protein [Marinobacter nanhaiticus D15-8W]BES73314.1 LapD/MoxY N-terminal periplasmic domain-containing protein [Marinobacter nanhaiticus D15-8W]